MTRVRRMRAALVAATCFATLAVGATTPVAQAVPAGLHLCPGFSGLDSNSAASVMAGQVKIPGFAAATIPGLAAGGPVDWAANPYGNSSWRIWFHSLLWLGNLEEYGLINHQQSYIDRAVAVTKDYLAHNPITTAAPQRNSMAHRTILLGCLAEATNDPTIRAAAVTYSNYLLTHWSGAWNWGLDEDLGVMTVGCELGHSDLTTAAANQLTTASTVMFDAQGATNEQAPGYGRYSFDRWRVVTSLMNTCRVTPPTALANRLALAAAFLASATQPDGHIVQIGDTVNDTVVPVAGTPLEYAGSDGTAGATPADRVSVFNAGYVFGRSTWSPMNTSSFYSLRFGGARKYHGHSDHMSLTYWSAGRPVVVDAGHVGYSNTAVRTYLLSPAAHNLMAMDGMRANDSDVTVLTRPITTPTYDAFTLAGTPYADTNAPYGKVSGSRNVLVARGPDFVVTYDKQWSTATYLHWNKGGKVLPTQLVHRQSWHLPAGGPRPVVVGRSRVTVGATTFLRVALPGHQLLAGSVTAAASYVAPQLNTTRPDWVVSMPQVGRSAAVLSVIVPSGTASATIVSVGTTGFTLRVTVNGVAHDVRITNAGAMTRLS
ncbi:MAG: hypothetical protein QOH99_240 [Frankiaceae bacterium]|nr:hypothetical protein [Frankiaceae bacterium]